MLGSNLQETQASSDKPDYHAVLAMSHPGGSPRQLPALIAEAETEMEEGILSIQEKRERCEASAVKVLMDTAGPTICERYYCNDSTARSRGKGIEIEQAAASRKNATIDRSIKSGRLFSPLPTPGPILQSRINSAG